MNHTKNRNKEELKARSMHQILVNDGPLTEYAICDKLGGMSASSFYNLRRRILAETKWKIMIAYNPEYKLWYARASSGGGGSDGYYGPVHPEWHQPAEFTGGNSDIQDNATVQDKL